jgi:protein gp37
VFENLPALYHYDAACRALAEATRIDEVKNILDIAVAIRAYAKQAKNRDAEANAVEIRMRATRRLDEMRRAQEATIGLNRGLSGSKVTGGSRTPVKDGRPTLASQGIDKSLAKQARVLGALSDESFETVVADARDKVARAVRKVVQDIELQHEPSTTYEEAAPAPDAPAIMLKTHLGEEVSYRLPKGKATFNATNEQVSWSAWTWNPVTGCLRDCEFGCYARELANRASYAHAYPRGFTPILHPERLDAPANTNVPKEAENDPRLKRVFVCSMGDLYGKWTPDDWIQRVHASCIASPQWDYLLLTKYPRRYVGLALPPTAWVGTSVHEQKLVRLAEEAFRQIKDVRVKWLSLEPLMEPLKFADLSMFDWIVIGSLSATEQPEGHYKEFAPPFEWVARIVAQARECGCRIYLKPNLLGANPNPQSPGMQMPQEEPDFDADQAERSSTTLASGCAGTAQ